MGPVVVLVGPTAAGKSALALDLAEEVGGEIVNADALQVYRGFDIGTAKPSAADRTRVRHHLVDILKPHEAFSAGRFARRARAAISEIEGRGGVALVVGGSGFYLRALLDGLSPLPPVEKEVRAALRRELECHGVAELRVRLERLDPASAARLEPTDTQRTLRALEVVQSSGRPLSEWVAQPPPEEDRIAAVKLGLTLPRGLLYDRISGRVERMIEAGWVKEVARLLERGVDPSAPAFQAIGYRQIVRHLGGEISLGQALEETRSATRRYAKRQLTWFRGDDEIRWIPAEEPETARRVALQQLQTNFSG